VLAGCFCTSQPCLSLCGRTDLVGSGSEAGPYLRLIDFVYHSTLGLGVIQKRRFGETARALRSLSSGSASLGLTDRFRSKSWRVCTKPHPRKSVRLTWENKSVYTEFVPTFRNFDFYLGRMLTYELKRCVKFDAASYWLLSPRVLRGWELTSSLVILTRPNRVRQS